MLISSILFKWVFSYIIMHPAIKGLSLSPESANATLSNNYNIFIGFLIADGNYPFITGIWMYPSKQVNSGFFMK